MPWATAISLPLLFAAMSAGVEHGGGRELLGSLSAPHSEKSALNQPEQVEVAQVEQRVVHWTSARAYGVPGPEVFDALEAPTTRVAGVGLGVASVASAAPSTPSRTPQATSGETHVESTATDARPVEAQLDVSLSSRPLVDLHLTPLGSLGARSTTSLLSDDSARGPMSVQPVVIRPRGRFEGGAYYVSDKARRAAGWTLVGGGLASGALATYFAVVATQHDSDDLLRNGAGCRAPSCRSMNPTGRPDARAMSSALGGAGIAVLATGGLFLMTTPALSFGQRTRVGAAVRSTNTGFLVMTGEW